MYKNLYVLRYRKGSTGVTVNYITASTLDKAIELGQWYCNQQFNCRFIRVEPAVVADEADMITVPVAPAVAIAAETRKKAS